MASDPINTRIGTEIAGFRIESVLGRGGMSVVYLAEQMRLGRKVALKVLTHELAAFDASFRDRFLQESHIAAGLDHPNIIPIYDAGEGPDCLYIAMRYIEGDDLGQVLEREGPLSLGRVLYILDQVSGALDAAHDQGLIHRDVKPANILLVGHSDRIYLTDFGVAKPTTSAGLTRTGFFIGTPDYSAPEQIEGGKVDVRTDVYALGAVLYTCLTGLPPFVGESEMSVLHAHLRQPPPRLSETRRDLPRGLDRVISTAMAKSPDDRYATCEELLIAARAASAERPTPIPAPVTIITEDTEEPPSAATRAVDRPPPAAPPSPPPSSGSPSPDTPPEMAVAGSEPTRVEPTEAGSPPTVPPTPPPAGSEPAGHSRRTRLIVAGLLAAVVALAAALAAVLVTRSGGGTPTPLAAGTTLYAQLTGAAEPGNGGASIGSGSVRISFRGTSVCWSFTLQGLQTPYAAHIHRGGPDTSGAVVIPLGGAYTPSGCTTAPIATIDEVLRRPGAFYVNVHTVAFPDGAIRGQLTPTPNRSAATTLHARLSGTAETGSKGGSNGSGSVTITVHGTSVCWAFSLQGLQTPFAAHIHRGGPGVSGAIVIPLGGVFKPHGCITAPAATIDEVLRQPASFYVNVHTMTFPDGAVRGQLAR